MNDDNLESKALCKVQKFHECSFCSNRRHAAGKQLVYYIFIVYLICRQATAADLSHALYQLLNASEALFFAWIKSSWIFKKLKGFYRIYI